MQLYRALPHGWRTTPTGTPTDLHMWQQILAHPDCVATSSPFTTVIGVPASERAGADMSARVAELAAWSPTTDIEVRERFLRAAQASDTGLLAHAAYEAEYTIALGVVDGLAAHQDALERELDETRADRDALHAERDASATRVHELDCELRRIHASRGWRALERLRRLAGRA
jgi:hypothetical protein